MYFIAGMFNIFIYKYDQNGLLPIAYIVILSLPLFIPQLARMFNMESINIFNLFKKKEVIEDEPSNVVQFPKPKAPLELVKPASRECYRIGYDEHAEMVSLTLLTDGGGSVTMRMNYAAAQQMIKMINTAFPEYDPELDESNK
jgi:hypothetical protein